MKPRRPFDLVVIGAEPAGLAAAACAAKEGARVAIFPAGDGAPPLGATPGVPDFVWRRLDLHDSGLDAAPVSAQISLFEGGRALATYQSAQKTRDALEEKGVAGHHLWTDFQADLDFRWKEGAPLAARAAGGRAGAALIGAIAANGPDLAARLAQSTRALVDDYFDNDDLKTHLASLALSSFGLAGDEPGSAQALASLSAPAAWRVKSGARGASLSMALAEAAKAAGVDFIEMRVLGVEPSEDKLRILALENGDAVRTRHVMAASEAAAARAGLKAAQALAPARRAGAVADIRLKFAKAPAPPAGDKDAIFFLADSLDAFSEARDAALEGRLSERAPLSFEYHKDDILVRAAYCPSVLETEGEARDWSEQDRQALGRRIVERLAPFLNGAAESVRRVEVKVSASGARRGALKAGAVPAPPPGHDAIGAAVLLALDLLRGE
ncbi:MAG: hypothetical protein AB7P23_11600 [Amphiplicatus sp.]